jgi:hypothetical protein
MPARAMSFGIDSVITRDERQAVMDCRCSQQAIDHSNSGSSCAGEMAPAVGDLLIDISYLTSFSRLKEAAKYL